MATQVERAIRQAGLLISNLGETGRKLGEGSYGEVVEVRVRGKRYAGKKLHKIFYERDVPPADTAAIAQRFEEECRRVPYLKHSNVVQMIGVHFHSRTHQPTLVMELMDTSLTRYLEEHASVPLNVKHSILLDVASGLVYLHTLSPPVGPIIHRDLTANNVLLSLGDDIIAKIADLGQARIVGRTPVQMARWTKCPGNVDHMPPEAQIDDPVYGTALDIFSYGVIMLHTLAHEWPEPLSKLDSAFQVRSEVERRKTYLDKIEGNLLKPLVVECLRDSAESRPVAGELTGALKLAMKLHPQIHSMIETHKNQVCDLQEQLQAEQAQEERQTKALKQQVSQLDCLNQELVQELSEQKWRLEQNIQRHIQEKDLFQEQLHLVKQELTELKFQNQQLIQAQSKQKERPEQGVQWPRLPENLHQKLLLQEYTGDSPKSGAYKYVQLQTATGEDQQQYVAGYSTEEDVRLLNNLPQTHAQLWQVDPHLQRARQPQGVDHTFHYPDQVPPAHARITLPEPPPDATRYQNVDYQNAGPSESTTYTNSANLLHPESKSEATSENTTVTQELRKLFQQYPELAGLPPQQKDTKQPAPDDDTLDLYGDDSNPVPVNTQTHHRARTSASGTEFQQYECNLQPSGPSSPRRLDKPIPRPRRSHSPSLHSSSENSPSTSPAPARHKISPIFEHSSQPSGSQLGVGMPSKVQSVGMETQQRKEIREKNPVDKSSSGSNLQATSETDQSDLDQHRPNWQFINSLEKNFGQDKSETQRRKHVKQPPVDIGIKRRNAISEPSYAHYKSAELNENKVDATTTTELEEQYQFSLGDTWFCSYCTNLVQATRHVCDVCGREKLETVV